MTAASLHCEGNMLRRFTNLDFKLADSTLGSSGRTLFIFLLMA